MKRTKFGSTNIDKTVQVVALGNKANSLSSSPCHNFTNQLSSTALIGESFRLLLQQPHPTHERQMPVFQLSDSIFFPPPELAREDGLLAVGGDLSPERLLTAYQMGIFPWYSQGEPILWWSPTPRLILQPHKFHLSKRLAREIRKGAFTFTADCAFPEVINNCAKPRTGQANSTWITDEMINAYCTMHELGYAHSIESWQGGKLAGGLYGLSLGGVFFGESMFSFKSNASKAALYTLSQKLAKWDFDFIDCQMQTQHLCSLGAEELSGPQFFSSLQKSIFRTDHRGKWTL